MWVSIVPLTPAALMLPLAIISSLLSGQNGLQLAVGSTILVAIITIIPGVILGALLGLFDMALLRFVRQPDARGSKFRPLIASAVLLAAICVVFAALCSYAFGADGSFEAGYMLQGLIVGALPAGLCYFSYTRQSRQLRVAE